MFCRGVIEGARQTKSAKSAPAPSMSLILLFWFRFDRTDAAREPRVVKGRGDRVPVDDGVACHPACFVGGRQGDHTCAMGAVLSSANGESNKERRCSPFPSSVTASQDTSDDSYQERKDTRDDPRLAPGSQSDTQHDRHDLSASRRHADEGGLARAEAEARDDGGTKVRYT